MQGQSLASAELADASSQQPSLGWSLHGTLWKPACSMPKSIHTDVCPNGPGLLGPRLECRNLLSRYCHVTRAHHGLHDSSSVQSAESRLGRSRECRFLGLPVSLPKALSKVSFLSIAEPNSSDVSCLAQYQNTSSSAQLQTASLEWLPSEFMAPQVWKNCGHRELIIGNQNSVVGAFQS